MGTPRFTCLSFATFSLVANPPSCLLTEIFARTVGVNVAGSVSVAPVTASWGEYSVTSAAAPTAGSPLGNFPVSAAGQFVSVDVTNQVQAWLSTPASNNGLP